MRMFKQIINQSVSNRHSQVVTSLDSINGLVDSDVAERRKLIEATGCNVASGSMWLLLQVGEHRTRH